MVDVEIALGALLVEAKQLCPIFQPAVFPQYFNHRSVEDLFLDTKLKGNISLPSSFTKPVKFYTEISIPRREITISKIEVTFFTIFNQICFKILFPKAL